MRLLTRNVLLSQCFLLTTSISLLAQMAPSLVQPSPSTQRATSQLDRGFYSYIGVGGGHDPFAKYSGELDTSGGYDFGRTLELEAGLPFFFLSSTSQFAANGSSSFSNRYSSIGDAFVRAKVTPALGDLDYTSTMTVTAPTGAKNVSAGQATWEWNNRVEMDEWHLGPFGEFVLGNVPPVTPRLVGPFTISGFASQLRLGNSFTLRKVLSFDASFYESIPIGNSSVVSQEPATLSPISSNLLSDHGITGSLSMATERRFDFDITYSRSLAHSLDAISFTVRYRFGHVRKEYE